MNEVEVRRTYPEAHVHHKSRGGYEIIKTPIGLALPQIIGEGDTIELAWESAYQELQSEQAYKSRWSGNGFYF